MAEQHQWCRNRIELEAEQQLQQLLDLYGIELADLRPDRNLTDLGADEFMNLCVAAVDIFGKAVDLAERLFDGGYVDREGWVKMGVRVLLSGSSRTSGFDQDFTSEVLQAFDMYSRHAVTWPRLNWAMKAACMEWKQRLYEAVRLRDGWTACRDTYESPATYVVSVSGGDQLPWLRGPYQHVSWLAR